MGGCGNAKIVVPCTFLLKKITEVWTAYIGLNRNTDIFKLPVRCSEHVLG